MDDCEQRDIAYLKNVFKRGSKDADKLFGCDECLSELVNCVNGRVWDDEVDFGWCTCRCHPPENTNRQRITRITGPNKDGGFTLHYEGGAVSLFREGITNIYGEFQSEEQWMRGDR